MCVRARTSSVAASFSHPTNGHDISSGFFICFFLLRLFLTACPSQLCRRSLPPPFDPPTSDFLTPRDPYRGWSPIMASSSPIDPATRKRVLKVIAVSLLLDLVCLVGHNVAPRGQAMWLTICLDLLHLHPATVSETARVLPRSRGAFHHIRQPTDAPTKCHYLLEQIQGVLLAPYRLSLRHCPARRRPGQPLLVRPPSSSSSSSYPAIST